jgi:predicted transcriptional regulator
MKGNPFKTLLSLIYDCLIITFSPFIYISLFSKKTSLFSIYSSDFFQIYFAFFQKLYKSKQEFSIMGRRPVRFEIESKIMKTIDKTEVPVTCSFVKKEISNRKKVHFDTVKKYLEELVQRNVLFKKTLPPTKKQHKRGMTLYSNKPFPYQ